MDFKCRNRLQQLIDSNTKSNVVLITHDDVQEFKSLLRGDSKLIDVCFESLFERLSSPHPQTRLLSLMLMDVVFRRSKQFRKLMVDNLEVLFALTLPLNPQTPLPSPDKTSRYLTEQAIEFMYVSHSISSLPLILVTTFHGYKSSYNSVNNGLKIMEHCIFD